MLASLKNTVITFVIGILLTIAAQGFTPLQNLTMGLSSAPASVPVVVAAPQSDFDRWWSIVMWSLAPIAIVVVLAVLVIGALRGASLPQSGKIKRKERDEDLVIRTGIRGKLQPLDTPPVIVDRTFSDGLRKLTRTILPLGYSDSGEIVTWDITQAPHIRVHGKTQGSGKTNLIKQIAACAVLAGHHVIVLDRRGYKDWQDFQGYVELLDNRKAGVFPDVTDQIKALYQRRDNVLGQYGAGDIEGLPKKYRHIFLVIAEFSTACREASTGDLEKVVANLKSVASEAGATGIHLVYEAQVVNNDWPRELRGNGDPICGYLPEDTSKAGGYSYAHELKPYQFHYAGDRFRTWDMKKFAWQVLRAAPRMEKRLIVERSQPVTEEQFGNGLGTLPPEGNARNVPVPSAENPLKRIYERSRSWEEVAKEYFLVYPNAEHADWCRAMSEIANDGRPHTAFKGRLSSSLFHRYSPKGDKTKVSEHDNHSS